MRIELFYVEKYDDDQPRDESGRWSSGGGGGGSSKPEDKIGTRSAGKINYPANRTASVRRLSSKEFRSLKSEEMQNTLERILRSPGGDTLNGLYAHVAQAYGQATNKELALKVDESLKSLYKQGKIEVKEEELIERRSKDKIEDRINALTGRITDNSIRWTQNPDGNWEMKTQKVYTIKATDKIPANIPKIPVPSHTLGVGRPDRFDPEPNGLAQKALDFRREEYPDTKMSPMGRYFSSSNLSPELMLGDDTPGYKTASGKEKFNRNEYFGKKGIGFFDATSSVTAHVGAMTGDMRSLQDAKLIARGKGDTPPHHELGKSLGLKESATTKPYFASLSNPRTGEVNLTADDFKGLKTDGNAIKEVAKAIWTPSSYGSPLGKATQRAMEELEKHGMTDKALIKSTAQKMTQNFKESAMYQFTPNFKSVVSEAPANFVYTNPMSGFKMSFNEYAERTHTVTLGDKRVSVKLPEKISEDANGKQKFGSAAPLFIQNWDAAVIGQLMRDMKSPHTAHDAIGIKKAYQKDLNKSVVKAMNMVKNFNPIKDLANQIMRQHLKNGMSRSEYRKMRARLNAKVAVMTQNTNKIPDFVVNPDTGNNHFQPEF